METIKIQRVESGDFCVKLYIRTKSDGSEWIIVGVYGAAQDALKPDFLAELVRICEDETLPGAILIMIILMPVGLLCSMPLLKIWT